MGEVTYAILADLVVLVHFVFVLFVILGGLLVLVRPVWIWFHLPAAIWGVVVELAGYVCPLTPLEIYLRLRGGGEGYDSDFVANYILPVLYPEELTRNVRIVLGLGVLVLNIIAYTLVYAYWKKR